MVSSKLKWFKKIHIPVVAIVFLIVSIASIGQSEIDSLENLATSAEPEEQMDLFNKMGKFHYRKGKYADALQNFGKALSIAQNLNDSLQIAKYYSNIGVINDVVGNYSEAINYYQESLKIYDKLDNKEGKESVLNNIGIVYQEMKEPQKALEYYFQALNLKIARDDKNSIAGTYNNIAIIYRYFHEDMDSAYYYYNKALEIYNELGNERGKALIYSNFGVILLREQNTIEARSYFHQALKVYEKEGNVRRIASTMHHLGLAYYAESNYSEALKYFEQSLELAEKTKIKKLLSQLYHDLARLYEKTGNYKKALEFNKKNAEIKDQLLNSEKVKQISQLETSFEIEKKEHEIELLTKQGELNELELTWTWTVIYSLLVIFILSVIIIILFFAWKRYKRQQEMLTLQSRLFRSQASPHFIFNSLMSIQAFLLENKVEVASEYLVDFAKLIRSILQHTRKSFISLDKEIEVLQQYVKLEKLRFSDKFDYEFIINVDDPEEIMVPPMLTQPFIENAILHGLVPSTRKGKLKLLLEEKDNILTFLIEDNGIGRRRSLKLNKDENHQSMATEITNNRLQLLLKRYNRKVTMRIEDLYDDNNNGIGTKVVFSITID